MKNMFFLQICKSRNKLICIYILHKCYFLKPKYYKYALFNFSTRFSLAEFDSGMFSDIKSSTASVHDKNMCQLFALSMYKLW